VFIINFSMNRFWAFRSRQPFMKQFITSGLLFALNLVVGNAIIYFFIDIVHLPDLLCWVPENFGKLVPKVIATGMAVTWNFFLYKYYIYK
jgi:putative flippase GtrA